MNRFVLYPILILLTTLIQGVVFDNLDFGASITPLVYIVFILMLPMQTNRFEMIFWSLLLGVSVDFIVGCAGLNTIATLAIGYLRYYALNFTMRRDLLVSGGVPLLFRVGALRFFRYSMPLLLLHSFLYFAFESMNPASWSIFWANYLISFVLTFILVWLLVVFFGVILFRYSKDNNAY